MVANCPACRGAPRTRTLPLFFHQYLKPWLAASGPLPARPLLAFAMVREEEQVLALAFSEICSVSLYANYRGDHEAGVDARDLSRFGHGCFSGSFSILTWDFFTEQEKAIAEAARTVAPGGVFIHQFSTARVAPGDMPPRAVQSVQKTGTYYSYLPDDHSLVSINVGIGWYIKALERGGFSARHVDFPDPHSGESNHWFLGRRCQP